MNTKTKNEIQERNCTYGVNHRIGELILKYPSSVILIIYIFLECMIIAVEQDMDKAMLGVKFLLPLFIILSLAVRFYHRNTCYKLIVDGKNKAMKFFLMCNQNIVNENVDNVAVVVDHNINFIVNGRKLVWIAAGVRQSAEFLERIGSYVKIKFVDGGYRARSFKRDLEACGFRSPPRA